METAVMETAISIPSDLFQQAEELAQQIGLTRDELYTRALRRLLKAYQDTELTRQLNEIYEHEDSSIDPILMQMQLMSLEPEEW
jgi:metal-responsive CopG/Arc/MetJ family transcriptional regulator